MFMPARTVAARSAQTNSLQPAGPQAHALQPLATSVYFSDFEANNGGFTVDPASANSSWTWGVPTLVGPSAAHSGTKLWATNLSGNYNDNENSSIDSPVIDLSGYEDGIVIVDWWQWINTEAGFDNVYVDASYDAGSNWTNIYSFSGDATTWTEQSVTLPSTFATDSLQIRFRMVSDSSNNFEGFYVDDVGISAEVQVNPVLWLPFISSTHP
jgi:bacillopeptidase F